MIPPRLPRKLFEWIAGPANVEDLLGDVTELFYLNCEKGSIGRAKLLYWRQLLSLAFSYALSKRKRDSKFSHYASSSLSFDMIKNYFKIAWRNLVQHKYFSALNVFGLAIGMSVSLLLISLYSFVNTYDNFHQHRDRIYTVNSTRTEGVEQLHFATAPLLLAERIEKEMTGVDEVVRIIRANDLQVKNKSEELAVDAFYVGPQFLTAFSFPIIQGDASSLQDAGNVLLTESGAKKLFNSVDVLGQTIELTNGMTLQVAGLMKDVPKNSHLGFQMLISLNSLPKNNLSLTEQWTNFSDEYIYLLLKPATSPETVQSFLEKVSNEVYKNTPIKVAFGTQQMADIVMGPDLLRSIGKTWDIGGFLIFGVFAVLILLPACFNYTNISIARALRRAKEIGLRKTMGGISRQIYFQFITETVVITLLALAGSVLIFMIIRDQFQSMLVQGASLDLSITWKMAIAFIIFAVITGIFAGIFPALYFSRLNPVDALKNKITGQSSSMKLRKVLTVFQFVLSFGFILALVVFSRQYRYSLNFEFGFQKDHIVDVQLKDVAPEVFAAKYSQLASVRSISMSSGLPGVHNARAFMTTSGTDSIEIDQVFVDEKFFETFKIELLAGKTFPATHMGEERFVVVNEEFVTFQRLQNPSDILGRTYEIDGHDLEVIGVVKNYHYAPLQYPIGRLCLRTNPSKYRYANLHVTVDDPQQLFTELEETWKTLPTETKMEADYFEDDLNDAFATYKVLLKMVGFLGLLAITISLLGMLGMVVYTSETKTKEVSIRKVMGASIGSLTVLLSKDYLKMMSIAIIVSVPLTSFLLNAMLPSLQYYHADISVWDIVISVALLVVLSLSTIASQTLKTARLNPADTLRME